MSWLGKNYAAKRSMSVLEEDGLWQLRHPNLPLLGSRAAPCRSKGLAALAVGATSDRGAPAESPSVRAARLAAIKVDIVANLDDGNLNAGMVAARNGITVRYLHKLFESEGVAYSEFVLGQRLGRAHAILRNPLHARRGVSKIAFELGFNDL